MSKKLIDGEVILHEQGQTNIWYRLEYKDTDGKEQTCISYGKDIEKACQKQGIDWLGGRRN